MRVLARVATILFLLGSIAGAQQTMTSSDVHRELEAAINGPQRSPGNIKRDKYRHPEQTLEFFGIRHSQGSWPRGTPKSSLQNQTFMVG